MLVSTNGTKVQRLCKFQFSMINLMLLVM